MPKFKTIAILPFLLSFLIFSGCTRTDSVNTATNTNAVGNANSAANATNDNIEEFGLVVKVPFELEEISWREEPLAKQGTDRLPTQNEKKLTAVMRFSPENTKKIVAEIEAKKAPVAVEMSAEQWFPAELLAQSEVSGGDSLTGQVYSAETFMLPPYTEGRIIKIDNSDYFILELMSK